MRAKTDGKREVRIYKGAKYVSIDANNPVTVTARPYDNGSTDIEQFITVPTKEWQKLNFGEL